MPATRLAGRTLASAAAVEHWKIRRAERLTEWDWIQLSEQVPKLCAQCATVAGEITLAKIRWYARRGKYSLLVADYDELISAPGATENDQQRNLVVGLKSLALELKIPVILVSQLRKSFQVEMKSGPNLQRLYGTGAKTKHASIVVYVVRKYVQQLVGDETEARLCVLKSRDGRVADLAARFNVKKLKFESSIGQLKPATGSSATSAAGP
jgi:replicative DNA helicase